MKAHRGHLIQALSHCDVIINLAGAPISKRWTPEYKKELYDSRIKVTHCIIRAMDAVKTKPRLMISASAVGYYPEEGTFDEYTNTRGSGFLAELCYAWEKGGPAVVRRRQGWIITRFGIVLSPDGGAWNKCFVPSNNAGSRCDRSGYTAFPLDCLFRIFVGRWSLLSATKRQAEFSTWWLRNKFHSMHLLRQWQHAIMPG